MKIFNKQKLLALGVCVFFLAVAYIMSSVSPVLAQEVQVLVNGQTVQFLDQKPFINKDNRVLVPVRAPMEAAGAHISWDAAAQRAGITKGNKTTGFDVIEQGDKNGKYSTINGGIASGIRRGLF